MTGIQESDGQGAEQRVIVWNGRIEELEGEPAPTPGETTPVTRTPELAERPAVHSDP